MSEFFIVCAEKHEHHEALAAAERERDMLSAHFPDKTFTIHRCKSSLHSAHHFVKAAHLLGDIERQGLTEDNRTRLRVLLATIGTRTPKFKNLSLPKKPLPLAYVVAP